MTIRTLASESLRRMRLGLPLVGLVLVASCGPAGICEDFDPMERTEQFVISESHAAEIAVAADAGYGRTCQMECSSLATSGTQPLRSCSVGGATDGGVALTCMFANVCR
jgi:hypothetical protein